MNLVIKIHKFILNIYIEREKKRKKKEIETIVQHSFSSPYEQFLEICIWIKLTLHFSLNSFKWIIDKKRLHNAHDFPMSSNTLVIHA